MITLKAIVDDILSPFSTPKQMWAIHVLQVFFDGTCHKFDPYGKQV